MKKKYTSMLICLVVIGILIFSNKIVYAEPIEVPNVNLTIGSSETPSDYVGNIKLLIILTILSLLPAFIIMMTCFTRIVVVLSFLKGALGIQQSVPNQVLVGLALFLTIFIMAPVYNTVNENAFKPYLEEQITQEEAIEAGSKPLREFMLKQTREKDLELFIETAKVNTENLTKENVPLYVVIPAFAISELKTAFQIGFLLYLPFLIIDIVVASILMSMGMFMVPPAMMSLPFKLVLFVMVDGWHLIVKSLITSFS